MSQPVDLACIGISVDVEPVGLRPGQAAPNLLRQSWTWLRKLLSGLGLPAAWCLRDPAAGPLAEELPALGPEHEVALLGDASWASPHAGRGLLHRTLSDRLGRARAAGLDVSTLALANCPPTDQTDLLYRHGLRVVRSAPPQARVGGFNPWKHWFARSDRATAPRALRWGLWEVPVAANTAVQGYRAILGELDAAYRRRTAFHLTIDLPSLAEGGQLAQRGLERCCTEMQRRLNVAGVDARNLREWSRRLLPSAAAPAARSILRVA